MPNVYQHSVDRSSSETYYANAINRLHYDARRKACNWQLKWTSRVHLPVFTIQLKGDRKGSLSKFLGHHDSAQLSQSTSIPIQ